MLLPCNKVGCFGKSRPTTARPPSEVKKMQAWRPSANQAGALVTVPPLAATELPSLSAVFRQESGITAGALGNGPCQIRVRNRASRFRNSRVMGRRTRLVASFAFHRAVFWPHTSGISRVSAGSCYAISWPEVCRLAPGAHPRFVQVRHRQTKPATALCLATQLAPRPLPTLTACCHGNLNTALKGASVQSASARYGPTQSNGASSSADFGFLRLSAREERCRLSKFGDRRGRVCANTTSSLIA
jgi:hypothetical protein